MMIDHPYRLRSIRVSDFKSIQHADVELCPLTVVVGANSSGKSSLLQMILAVAQVVRLNNPGTTFPLNGDYVKFGTFNETVNFASARDKRQKNENPRIEFSFTVTVSGDDMNAYYFPDEYYDPEYEPSSTYKPDESREQQYMLDWSVQLISNTTTGGSIAKLDSIRLYDYIDEICYVDNTRKKIPNCEYKLDACTDIDRHDEKLGYYIVMNDMINSELLFEDKYPFPANITSIDGQYYNWDTEKPFTFAACHATKLKGAIPRTIYTLSSVSDFVGTKWWNIAQLILTHNSDKDTNISGYDGISILQSDDASQQDDTIEDNSKTLETMVLLAAQVVKDFQPTWKQKMISIQRGIRQENVSPLDSWFPRRHSKIIHEQIKDLIDPKTKSAIAKVFETETIEKFLTALTEYLAVEGWGKEQIWKETEEDFTPLPALNLSGRVLHHLFAYQVRYLGPLRKSPQVHYDHQARELDIGTRGEYTAAVLHANSKRPVVPISDSKSNRPDSQTERVTLESEVNHWLEELGLASRALSDDQGRLGIGLQITPTDINESVPLTSVGVGISQLLPVIVVCLLAEPGDLVILEQPELHLHPALQQQLGDFLLDCVKSGRQVIVETHSDHLVNRLRRRTADPSGADEDMVGLLYAEKHDGVTSFRQSAVDPYGGTDDDWPEGFFDVSAREAQALVYASLTKRYRNAD